MESEVIGGFLSAKDVNLDWSCLTVNGEDCLYCPLVTPSNDLLFCIVPLVDKEPFVALLAPQELQQQCRDQGFMESSIDQIHAGLLKQASDPSSALSLQRHKGKIELSINLSMALKITLSATIMENDPTISSIILRRLLNDVLAGGYLLQGLSSSRVKILDSKDRAIEFMRETIEEPGDRQALNKWAPKGSMNYQALEKYNEDAVKNAIFAKMDGATEDSSKEAHTLDLLLTLRKEMKQYRKTNNHRPTKVKATKLPSDFAPTSESDGTTVKFDNESNNASVKLDQPPMLVKEESPVVRESPSSSRESSKSPRKKHKFRRVKITK